MHATKSPSPDLVLLVHGTYAARDKDQGASWWQIGSDCYENLRQRLPNGVGLNGPDEVFHWSGENSERDRIKAAVDLLSKLKKLETEGRGYHLIGHSHGGSVIWHALRIAALGRNHLKRLKSWTTVGTPFLRHQTASCTRIANMIRLIIGLALVYPAYATAVKFFDLLFRPERCLWLTTASNDQGDVNLYNAPVIRLLQLLHLPVNRIAEDIRVGGMEAGSTHSRLEFLITSPTGWLLMALALAVIYLYLNLAVFALRPVLESWQLRAELGLERRARNHFGSRWLGIWSPDDEAINGLRATLDLTVSFVSRMAPHERVLFSDYLALIWQPYYWILTPVFNSVLRPFLDRIVRSYVVKAAQGNNRPGADVVMVTPVPWNAKGSHAPINLPHWLNEQLVRSANTYAQEVIPDLRKVLAAPSFVSGLESWGKDSLGRELIHTSYFDHPEVLDLLGMHIAWSSHNPEWPQSGLSEKNRELGQWLLASKSTVGAKGHTLPAPSQPAQPEWVAPRLAEPALETELRVRIKPRRRIPMPLEGPTNETGSPEPMKARRRFPTERAA